MTSSKQEASRRARARRPQPRRTLISAVHPNPTVKINHGATFLVTDQDGAVPLSAGDCGLFSHDTRYLSRHEVRLNGRRPQSVASVRLSFEHARWHLIADNVEAADGDMRGARVAMTVDRVLDLHRMHEDFALRSYGRTSLTLLLEIALESDFADHSSEEPVAEKWQMSVARIDPADIRLQFAYERAIDDFAALRLHEQDSASDRWMPAAGLPWFMALFGRDSLIASMQGMVVSPAVAIGTLENLARWQSDVDEPERDAEPGKIPHELRVGEWAHFGIIPHRPYYGTADATPLYLLLLAEHHRWVGDANELSAFKATAERCLDWIDRYGDRDGDGFQEYAPRAPNGYRNQAWRDAHDGVLDENGIFPELPIGTCEMQAYVYAAKLHIAPLFEAWGDRDRAHRLVAEAMELRRRFHESFWLEDRGELAFALDGNKKPVRTAVSNPGHCLWMGILDPAHGRLAGERLMRPDMFSGWGVRTLSEDHPSYDPHSYQRGSVWPHDSVMAAAGLRRYGLIEESWKIIDGLLTAVMCFEDIQMPELFAGLRRAEFAVPVPYRMANVPQAWSAGAILQMVRILLGLEPDVPAGKLYVDPMLPPWCPVLTLHRLHVGGHEVRVHAERKEDGSCTLDVESPASIEVVRGTPPWMDLVRD